MIPLHRRHALLGGLGLALSATARARAAGEAPLSDDPIRALLAERVDRKRQSRGMVVAVTDQGRRRIVVRGEADGERPRALDSDTVFGLASLSKPFTALLLADAVARGELALDDAASDHLPPGAVLPERNGRKITLIDLATHTTGLPHELPAADQAQAAMLGAPEARAILHRHLAQVTLPTEIGAAWSYSNLDYAVLGHVLERRTGLSYEALLRRRVTRPLGMDSTTTALTPALRARRAGPHDAALQPAPEWRKPWAPAMIQSTANDLLRFLEACLGQRETALTPAFQAMMAVRRPAPALGAEQALGWYVYPFGGRPMAGHTGAGGGFAASALFDPAAGAGVVVLSNTELIQEDLARHVLRPSLPLDQTPVAIDLDPKVVDGYLGDYRDATGAVVSILREPRGPVLKMPQGYRAPLTPESATAFFVKGYAGLTVVFDLDAQGRATGLVWTLGGKATPARRVAPASP
jgi:CubicO group peptidase (beta-lactamase class C family)